MYGAWHEMLPEGTLSEWLGQLESGAEKSQEEVCPVMGLLGDLLYQAAVGIEDSQHVINTHKYTHHQGTHSSSFTIALCQ